MVLVVVAAALCERVTLEAQRGNQPVLLVAMRRFANSGKGSLRFAPKPISTASASHHDEKGQLEPQHFIPSRPALNSALVTWWS